MVHRSSLLRALAGVATGLVLAATAPLALPAAPAQAAPPEDDAYDAPLEITIDALAPGVLPRSGPLTIRGTITNVDLETWSTIRIYPMFNAGSDCVLVGCAEVMTTAAELELAADSDPEAAIGVREPTVRDDIATLQPGQSAGYTLRIPQPVLRSIFPDPASGVYWLGVHALGASAGTPDDTNTDGRARTFLPYAAPQLDAPVDTAVVVPLRGRVGHTQEGALDRTDGWESSLAFDGDLGGPLAFGAASGGAPVTWLVDPAIPDAVQQLARGNPDRKVLAVPDPDASPSGEPSDEEGEEGDGGDSGDGEGSGTGETGPDLDTPLARAAGTWLERARAELDGGSVALLPYGDPDVSAAADAQPSIYRSAREQAGRVLGAWEVEGTAVVAPPDGYLDRTGIDSVDDKAPLLLGERMFPTETFSERPPVGGLVDERPVLVTSQAAAEGGPGPDPAQAPVALRQRLLSEAVVRLLRAGADTPEPLVVVLPPTLTADGAPEFWSGLDDDLVRVVALDQLVVPVGSAIDGRTDDERQIDPDELSSPASVEKAELPGSVLAEAGRLVRAARTYQSILGEDYTIGAELVGEALTGTSYAVRSDDAVEGRLARTRDWVQDQLDQVVIDAPPGVTLSGTSGGFNVAVRNELDHPVTVQVRASTDDGAEIEVANPVRLAANSRTSVPINATMTRPGVHNVTLRLTDVDGQVLGAADTLPLRTGQAGIVIWAIIGAGGGILFVAIAIRLVRRFRARDEDDAPEPVA